MNKFDCIALGLLAGSAVAALLYGRFDRGANIIGAGGCIAALLLKIVTAWTVPLLNLCFQLPIILVGIAAAWHSIGYMEKHGRHRMSWYWFLFNATVMAMLAVTMLERGLAFLVMWELMGLASFGLVAFEWKKSEVGSAAWIYLLACEAGGLLLVWVLTLPVELMGVMTAGTLVAFGLKAGFPLLHVWLPEAHPAAPAPVSAVMSGAMIPLGFYGIMTWSPWVVESAVVGWFFLIAGLIGMFVAILFGGAQSNLKRLLAYSSVENIGIITLALALGILGRSCGNSAMAVLGFSGAALHIINHALLKGTLFLGAGSVYKSMHDLNMDAMGGLMHKMPATAMIFSLAGMGISGLPPFCGFTGELLIYLAAFQGIASESGVIFAASAAGAVTLALTGGLAAAALAKTISAVFAGEPRSSAAEHAAAEELGMVLPQLLLCALSLLMTLAAPLIMGWVLPETYQPVVAVPLIYNALFAMVLIYVVVVLLLVRKILRKRRGDSVKITWDCGYVRPDGRMQYTASAFFQPLADLFNGILRQQKQVDYPGGFFPAKASMELMTPDGGSRWFWNPLFKAASYVSEKVKHLQSGLLHIYILIMVLAIMLMLGWSFIAGGGNADVKTEAVSKVVSHE